MRVLVCGGRDLDRNAAHSWLDRYAEDEIAMELRAFSLSIGVVIHGGARGADQGGADWGQSIGAQVLEYKANWKKHGKAAGPIRNRIMLEQGKPDVVLALPGGRGTENMVRQAEGAGVPVIRAKIYD